MVLATGIGASLILALGAWSVVRLFWGKREEVFLSDLEPVEIQGGTFGNQGQIGSTNKVYAVVGGRRSLKGLIRGASRNGEYCQVTYRLGKRYRLLNTAVALNDTAREWPSWSFRFSIFGDGRLLWESQPVRKYSDTQQCEISVAGVDLLQLGFIIQGMVADHGGPVVWVDPRLTR